MCGGVRWWGCVIKSEGGGVGCEGDNVGEV